LKKGIEAYSRRDEGALYTYKWAVDGDSKARGILGQHAEMACPMHEDPLKLIPDDARAKVAEEIHRDGKPPYPVQIRSDLCPAFRYVQREFLKLYKGDWTKVVDHIRVHRIVLSERDRVGIGTFQPKDEKNQDSTELTGDINYRRIAEYGSDSDPRAFN